MRVLSGVPLQQTRGTSIGTPRVCTTPSQDMTTTCRDVDVHGNSQQAVHTHRCDRV
jgi:hypothetical protein